MTTLEVQPYIKKLAKKDNMTVDEALSVIQQYDTAVKAVKETSDLDYAEYTSPGARKLKKVVGRNANIVGFSGIGILASAVLGSVTGIITGIAEPSIILVAIPTAIPAVIGIAIAAGLEVNKDAGLHRVIFPSAYKQAKGEIEMEKQLAELKRSDFEQAEAKMLKKTSKALAVVNEFLESKDETMVYSNVSAGGSGYTVMKTPEPTLDQWTKIRQQINDTSEIKNGFNLTKKDDLSKEMAVA